MGETNLNQKYINKSIIRGTVIRKIRKEDKWVLLTILTHSNPMLGSRRDYPTVFFYGNEIELADKFNEGDHVTIEAMITTSRYHRTETVYGIAISETKKEEDKDLGIIDLGRFLPDKNEVCIKGEIVHMFDTKNTKANLIIVTVKTVVNGIIAFPQIACFGRQYNSVIKELKDGDYVCILAHVQTDTEYKDGQRIRHQSLVSHFVEKVQ